MKVSKVESLANLKYWNLTTTVKNVRDGILINANGVTFEDMDRVSVSGGSIL